MNFPLPPDWRVSMKQSEVPPFVDRVNANAGDAIIFTEACAHGTVPWESGGERRTVFYKYCPHAVAWGPCYYNADHYGDLTENQRAILTPAERVRTTQSHGADMAEGTGGPSRIGPAAQGSGGTESTRLRRKQAWERPSGQQENRHVPFAITPRRCADYIPDRYYGDGVERSTIRKEINAMLEGAHADERARCEIVSAASTSPTERWAPA